MMSTMAGLESRISRPCESLNNTYQSNAMFYETIHTGELGAADVRNSVAVSSHAIDSKPRPAPLLNHHRCPHPNPVSKAISGHGFTPMTAV